MKRIPLLLSLTLVNVFSYSQVEDTTKNSNPTAPLPGRNYLTAWSNGGQPLESYEVKDGKNVTFKTVGHRNIEIVEKIMELEGLECEALKKRDSIRLMTLWTRDFTLDQTGSVVSSKGGIPYYTSLYRMVVDITPIDSVTVISTGTEYRQQIGEFNVEDQHGKFFHIWSKQHGVWKLSAKRFP